MAFDDCDSASNLFLCKSAATVTYLSAGRTLRLGNNMANKDECDMPPEMAWRVAVSIAVCIGWVIFLVLFLGFFAGGFSIYQNLAIIIASILGMALILGPIWAHWGMLHAKDWEKKKASASRRKRKK